MYQISLEDISQNQKILSLPGRTAYIDECGNFGFEFDNKGTSLFFIICAVIVDDTKINSIEKKVEDIKRKFNFQNGEMKSSNVGEKHKRRAMILTELIQLDFSLVLLIADKQAFYQDSALSNYRDSFIKFLHQKMYDSMYALYPKLSIIEDEYGGSEFQKGYKEYIRSHRPELNLFNDYNFDYIDSKYSPIVQIADFIAGSIDWNIRNPDSPDALRIFRSQIRDIVNFPPKLQPFAINASSDHFLDGVIYNTAYQLAQKYIAEKQKSDNYEDRLRVAFLKNLLFKVIYYNHYAFITSDEIIRSLSEVTNIKIRQNYLFRRIIAPLRDYGVIIASCSHGYKIPFCVHDIYSYANQTNSIIGPMLNRMDKCRTQLLTSTDGQFDLYDNPVLKIYRRMSGD